MKSEVEVMPKKVTLKPFRKNTHLPEDHDGAFRFMKTFEELTVQRDKDTGILNTGLTEEDERRLENAMRLNEGTLSKYSREWWGKFKIQIPKNGVTFDTSLPMDEIRYKVCMAHQEVAKSDADKYFTPFARYVLTSEEQESKALLKEIEVETEAYKLFNNMTPTAMREFLLVTGKRAGKDSTDEFVKSTIGQIVKKAPQAFIDIVKDNHFKIKLFIQKCVEANIMTKEGTKYSIYGDKPFAFTLEQAVDYLSNMDNQNVYMTLKSQLEAKK